MTCIDQVSINKFYSYRAELKRLTDLDFFRTHIHFYEEMGKNVFKEDDEYVNWLKTVPTLEGN